MSRRLVTASIVASLAGFLFGFDTIVISGAEQSIQKIWEEYTLFGRNDLFHGIIVVGSALWGTVVGALFGAAPNDALGRKKTLIIIGFFYTVSAIGSAMASDPWIFALFRFLGGLGVGASTIAAPAFISEIAPREIRGRLVASYQFNIVLGILMAFVSNALCARLVDVGAWRWMIGMEALPALAYTLMVMRIPESPRWLIAKKNDVEKARAIFMSLLNNREIVDKEINAIADLKAQSDTRESIFGRKYRFPLSLAFLVAFFNQFSGINAILYYANRIFGEAGLAEQAGALGTIGLGITNFFFTLLGMFLIDKLGRKQLLYIGSVGYIVSLLTVSLCFSLGWTGLVVAVALFVFIASHAVGQGAVIWVLISEIFPNHLRSTGQAFGSSVHWLLAAIIPSMIPFLFMSIGPGSVFLIFAIMMVLQLLWVSFFVPETKGKSLEELEKELVK
jgi:sugar porter (SP) family MFS transporter